MKTSGSLKKAFILTISIATLISCSNQETPLPESNDIRVECTQPRPEVCTKEFRPVCATKDNGVRCVTTPCDSTDEVTYSNACLACADSDVYSHQSGKCE
jgi:hypothetical protein